ncbi:NAD(P)/FAD-dependent oxidoreductase [Leucobacter albus]|uniref:NAD(P)/FAD-dependent oxidoreductase n=1 Tax=Leucobacter albus TaxID=272210 RepID=A0ABW3TNJ8_9MICO
MTRVIVIGAGAVGLASAYYLRKAGHDVTVVDQAPLAAKASGHNAGWLIPSMSTPVPAPGMMLQAMKWMVQPDSPLYVTPSLKPSFIGFMLRMLRSCTDSKFREGSAVLAALSATALSDFDELAAEGVEFEQHDEPLAMLFTNGHKVEGRVTELELLDGKLPGFSWNHMSDADLKAHKPVLSDRVAAGIESRGDRSVDPGSFVRGLAAACEREGVELRLGAPATLETGAGGSVAVRVGSATHGSELLSADRVVVAAGAWTNEVLKGIGERVPLQSGKGYGYDFPVVPGGPTKPIYLAEAKVAITPLDTKVRLAGTMGFTGVDESIKRRRAGGILTGVSSYFEGWPDIEGAPEPWTGLRPTTPDGLPIIGALAKHPSVLVATGHVMLGISLAPTTGKLITDLVAGGPVPELLRGVSADRF